MKQRILKRNTKGFVILFAVSLAGLLLAIALGVSNIASKEIKFGTSARDTSAAFFAADSGIECAVFHDKNSKDVFPLTGQETTLNCGGATIPIEYNGTYNFTLTGLGSTGVGCAKVNVIKENLGALIQTTVVSKGYNTGDSSCGGAQSNRVERELKVVYSVGNPIPPGSIALRDSAQASLASGNLVINKPAGTSQNDVLIASIAIRPQTASISAPAGWTLVRRLNNPNPIDNSLATYYKVAGGSEPATYTWTLGAHGGASGGVLAFSGVNVSNPINAENGQNVPNNGDLSSATPSINTNAADTMIVAIFGVASSATWTPPSGMTEVVDTATVAPPNNAGESIAISFAIQTAAGATGVKTAVQNSSGGAPAPDFGNSQIIALQP